jgi:hypothetical protein
MDNTPESSGYYDFPVESFLPGAMHCAPTKEPMTANIALCMSITAKGMPIQL